MGHVIRRVPIDFNWPIDTVWEGFLRPDRFDETPCPACKNGYSPAAQNLYDLWYGYLPFDPASTGSTPLRHDTPGVRAFAERNVTASPDFYGAGEAAIVREGRRLATLWNGMWLHHLSQDDVDVLVAEGRLKRLTHTWNAETRWQPIEPAVAPTAEQVNTWSLSGFGHDASNASIVIRARCKREGIDDICSQCQGHASTEAYPGQRAEAEAWEATEPPEGDGWQLWETVSEGSPMSPPFATAEELAAWMSEPERGQDWVPQEVAARFIASGWAPTGISGPGIHGVVSGVEGIGTERSE